MDLAIQDKVAIVTGASSGIAKACALQLAKEGCKVVICSRSEERIKKAANKIREETGATVHHITADVSKPEDLKSLFDFTIEKHGTVHILINNSGGPAQGNSEKVSEEDWTCAYQDTLMSIVRMSTLVLPVMKKQKYGRIINITSCSTYEPIPNLILSNTFRPAIAGFSKSLSNEVAEDGITINNILPGTIHTLRHDARVKAIMEREGKTEDQVLEQMRQKIPMKRIGSPEELSSMVTYLCSPLAGYITGTNIRIDGGRIKGW